MRTKALIGAAIAMAAGILSASAQVYSVNVVGYVNATYTGNQLFLAATPLDDGTNNVKDLLPTAPNGTSVQIWTGTQFSKFTKSTVTGNWPANSPFIPPGTGFFISPQSTFTNTYVGNVDCAPGGGQTNKSLLAGHLVLVGSIVPFAGLVTDAGTNTLNFGAGMPNGTSVQFWATNAYKKFTKSTVTGNWPANTSAFSVGQGFFVSPSTNVVWTQTLQ
jgi:hypothetical protein